MELSITYKDLAKPLRPVHIDDLCRNCKLFRQTNILNNGYGCLEQDKGYPGRCHSFDCPIAYEMDKEDFEGSDIEQQDDMVIQYKEVTRVV